MKKYLWLSLAGLIGINIAWADGNDYSNSSIPDDDGSGYYVGLNLGYADQHLNRNAFFQSNSLQTITGRNTNGFAGRAEAGYAFNPNFALEFGGTYLPQATALGTDANGQAINVTSQAYLVDLLFRTGLQFQHNIFAYAKLGMSYDMADLNTSFGNSNAKVFYPIFGAGIAYAVTSEFSVDAEWYHLFNNSNAFAGAAQNMRVVTGNSAYTALPEVDMFTGGVMYRF